MNAEATGARAGHAVDPFLLPSPTTYRFALLVTLVAGLSCVLLMMLHNSLPSVWERRMQFTERCQAISNPVLPSGVHDVDAGGLLRDACMAPVNRAQGTFMLSGLGLLAMLAFGLYWTGPSRKIRRDGLEPIPEDDAPEVLADLAELVKRAALRQAPRFLWSPTNAAVSGVAFGRRGAYYVALSGGLVALHYTDPAAFRSIVLHELAHLRNRDIDVTNLTVSTSYAFLGAVVAPFAVSRWFVPPDHLFGFAWRLAASMLLVWLTRNEVLRTREHYADLRVLEWEGKGSALKRIFESQPHALSRRDGLLGKLRSLLDFHPSAAQRRAMLDDWSSLLRPDAMLAVATGAAATIGIRGGSALFGNFIVLRLTGWLERLDPGTWIMCAVVGTLSAYVIGSDLWEAEMLAATRARGSSGGLRMGVALGLGLVLGYFVDMTTAVTAELGVSAFGALCWVLAATAASVIATKGFADAVHAWLVLGGPQELLARARSFSILVYAVLLASWLTALTYGQMAMMASPESLADAADKLGGRDAIEPLGPFLPLAMAVFTLVMGFVPTLTMTVLALVPFLVLLGVTPRARAVRPARALAVGLAAGCAPLAFAFFAEGTAGLMTTIGSSGLSIGLLLAATATAVFVGRRAGLLGWLHALTCGVGAGAVTWLAYTLLVAALGADLHAYYQVGTTFNVIAWLTLGAGLLVASSSRAVDRRVGT